METIGYSTKGATSTYEVLYNTAIGNMIIVLAGAVPGYWVSVATLDTLGRKTIQLGGFIILTILFIVMGFAYYHISANGLLAIYVLAQFFFNFGPNVRFCKPPSFLTQKKERESASKSSHRVANLTLVGKTDDDLRGTR